MLKVTNLTKRYGDVNSVDDMSFSIGEHEVVGLLGKNGAGKSTTIRMLTGYLARTSGDISFMGQDVADMDAKARLHIGYLPEIPPLYTELTVYEHIKIVCQLKKMKKSEIPAEVKRVCGLLQVDDVMHRCIQNLSKGYKQRVGFAAAIVGSPKLLVLDEPAVGLDPKQLVELRNLIKNLSKEMTIILSSHMLTEITSVCTRIIMIQKGRLIADGTPEEIRDAYSKEKRVELSFKGNAEAVYTKLQQQYGDQVELQPQPGQEDIHTVELIFADGLDHREELFHTLVAMGIVILTLREVSISLEEIFMEMNRQME
ncbi:ABC transporter ATP-binding protein [Chakrabartyella piscis]|uniref:ABC transporter ATP-binding protein n=1 Tax=Chakrabartyella piscis TaxID=2918914 RepID=UPI0029586950|nr:ABC transporter ATP-binding protein [Chakrabartyella piscis]